MGQVVWEAHDGDGNIIVCACVWQHNSSTVHHTSLALCMHGVVCSHPGDTVRFELDHKEHTISLWVANEYQGVIFKNVHGEVFPAVAFYRCAPWHCRVGCCAY